MARYLVQYTAASVLPSQAFPNRNSTPRPVLAVILVNGNLIWPCYAIVDSGADDCVFPASFAARIGLNLASGRHYPFRGAGGGDQDAHFFDIQFVIPNVTRYRLAVGFTPALEGAGIGLLGQNGFFSRFRVGFNLRRGLFTLDTI